MFSTFQLKRSARLRLAHQGPLGEFEVHFNVYPLLGGWRSLELIASALVESEDRNSLKLTLWSVGGGTSVNFELEGRENADPGALATILNQMRQLFDDEIVDECDRRQLDSWTPRNVVGCRFWQKACYECSRSRG